MELERRWVPAPWTHVRHWLQRTLRHQGVQICGEFDLSSLPRDTATAGGESQTLLLVTDPLLALECRGLDPRHSEEMVIPIVVIASSTGTLLLCRPVCIEAPAGPEALPPRTVLAARVMAAIEATGAEQLVPANGVMNEGEVAYDQGIARSLLLRCPAAR